MERLDMRERGANGQASTRRLFVQLQVYGECGDAKPLIAALEASRIGAVLYADLNDPRGVGVLTLAEDPAFFAAGLREVLGVDPFTRLSPEEQGAILREHGALGRAYGDADLAHDIRLACHGLDTNDNDFVIGLVGRELHPLSHLVQTMRKTAQTSQYIQALGPFFVGHVLWQSSSRP
jgi:hypothetical protein